METVVQAKALNKHRIKWAHVVLKVYPQLIPVRSRGESLDMGKNMLVIQKSFANSSPAAL